MSYKAVIVFTIFICLFMSFFGIYNIVIDFENDNHYKKECCIKVSEDYLMSVYTLGYASGANSESKKLNYNMTEYDFEKMETKDTTEFRKQIKSLVKH